MKLNRYEIQKQMQDWSNGICENACLKGECLNGKIVACENCMPNTVKNALALINSQEQRIKELTDEKDTWEAIAKSYQKQFEDCGEDRAKLTEENERLRADKKGLINENEELKNQIQEPLFSEEDIDLLDEYTRLLNEGIRDAKANNLSEIKTRFALRYGTYTDKDMTPIIEVFRLLDQIAKEMLEGDDARR